MNKDKQPTIDIRKSVLDQVSAGNVKMRGRWQFVAEKIGLESSILLSLVIAVLAASLFLHYWEINELHKYFFFGTKGIWRLVMNFPYEVIAILVMFLVLANYLVKKMDWGYKRSWLVWAGVSLGLLVVFSSAAFFVGFHEMIEENANSVPGLSTFYQNRIKNLANQSLAGFIEKYSGGEVTVLASGTSPITFMVNKIKIDPKNASIIAGEKIKMIGNWENNRFEPWEMTIVSQKPARINKWRALKARFGGVK